MVVRAGLADNKELRKKAERLAAVEAEKEMLEKQSDDLALERDTKFLSRQYLMDYSLLLKVEVVRPSPGTAPKHKRGR